MVDKKDSSNSDDDGDEFTINGFSLSFIGIILSLSVVIGFTFIEKKRKDGLV